LTAQPRTLPEWLDYQQRQHPQAIDLQLGRVRRVAERLGLVPACCRSIIVGGTNGKGSTAALLAVLLRAHGKHVGLFTSPHLVHYRERIAIDGKTVEEADLVAAFEQIEAARGGEALTFFEYNALAALQLFRTHACDAMVLEVGLGGRLDATNVIDADVAVLCSVGLDHIEWLGSSLEAIGREKAGIFRAGQPIILGTRDMPQSVYEAAAKLQAPLCVAEKDFFWQLDGDGHWSYRDAQGALSGLPPPALAGAIQYRNAATALAALRAFFGGRPLEPGAVAAALQGVRLPGRFQIVPGPVEWVLDVAHNAPAAAVLAEALAQRDKRRTIAVAGMLGDKDVAAVGQRLDQSIDHWILCSIAEPRGLSGDELRARLGSLRAASELAADVPSGCERARQGSRNGDRVVVFGSFHTVGPALQWLALY
jgi:dihydrofolate synthase / folylpolyglutamate synthase